MGVGVGVGSGVGVGVGVGLGVGVGVAVGVAVGEGVAEGAGLSIAMTADGELEGRGSVEAAFLGAKIEAIKNTSKRATVVQSQGRLFNGLSRFLALFEIHHFT